ncbi:MAG: hypothetical protein ABWY06_11545 [Pseudomonas sp.]|uniref:hypothetical protein n=1 Tax=Pseudomonas sp. TaxID=306 RepID=UPI0033944B36
MRALPLLGRGLCWSLGLLLVLVLLGYLLLVLINWRDEPPSPAALELSQRYQQRQPPADADNAFMYLMGFTAAAGMDPVEQGRVRLDWTRNALAQPLDQPWQEPEQPKIPDYRSMRSNGLNQFVQSCIANEPACTERLLSDPNLIEHWLASERQLLERYLGLLRYPRVHDPLPVDIRRALPDYGQILDGQRLLLAQAWQLGSHGEIQEVKSLLSRDLGFWRQALADADTLINKVIAVAAIKQHFFWGNRILAQLPAERQLWALPGNWELPLSPEERSMARVAAGEWTFGQSSLRLVYADRGLRLVLRPLLQEQASSNRYAHFLRSFERDAALPYPKLVDRLDAIAKLPQDQLSRRLIQSRGYNLAGTLQLGVDNPGDFHSYSVRVADLEGLRRSAVLLAQLRSEGVTVETLAAKLPQAELNNPYTEAPFDWDPGSASLSFASPGRGEVYRLQF